MDLLPGRQVNPLMEASAAELAEGLHSAPFLGVEQRTLAQMIHLFDFQSEVSPL